MKHDGHAAPLLVGAAVLLAASCAVACRLAPPPAARTSGALAPVAVHALCVTSGHLAPAGGHRVHVDDGAMRAVMATARGRTAELAFVYDGPSATTTPLADGEVRRQIGLKLRAQDTCNVVYVMWHVEPSPGVFVLLKHNAGASRHAECGDGGYVSIKPEVSTPAPRIERGAANVLRVEVDGTALRVQSNGREVWRGRLPEAALQFDGPIGVRSDNGSFDFELRVPEVQAAPGACPKR